jgi:thiosulfate dehydrogenase [quinone] large subunit
MAEKISLGVLTPLRLYVGAFLLKQGMEKASGDFLGQGMLAKQIEASISKAFIPAYASFLESVVLPHERLFVILVTLGEIGVGLSLLLGLLTRFGSLVGMFLMLNYYLAIGSVARGGSQAGVQISFFLAQLTFLTTSAGRHWGLDRYLKKRYPRSWLF